MGIGDFSPTRKTDREAAGSLCRFFSCVATHALLAAINCFSLFDLSNYVKKMDGLVVYVADYIMEHEITVYITSEKTSRA